MVNPYFARECPTCAKSVGITILGKYRQHKNDVGDTCDSSGTFIPTEDRQLPPDPSQITATHAHLPKDSLPSEPLTSPSSTGAATSPPESSGPELTEPLSAPSRTTSAGPNPHRAPLPTQQPTTATTTVTTAEIPSTSASPATTPSIPGVEDYARDLAKAQLGAYRGIAGSLPERGGYSQPHPQQAYAQPAKVNPVITEAVPMGDLGKQITVMLKEMFYQYTNQTGRSAQDHLGPSEIGTPCDRRLAMQIMRMPHVNPGGDNWASFVGTCIHEGLAKMFDWADARQGRFVTEQVVRLPNGLVPKGTADLIDRTLFMVDDHKCQGQWAADKLKREGPSQTYRVQLHIYAFGARLRGERIEHVGLISWPRDKSNLDNLYCWTERYDPAIARNALARIDRIAHEIDAHRSELEPDGDWARPRDWEVAERFAIDTSEGCGYCPFHLRDAKDLSHGGCNGRK